MTSNLSNEDKVRIHRLHEQGFGAKALRASYPDRNWSLNTLKTICLWVDVTRHAGGGRLICHKSSCIRQSYHFGADFDRMLLQLMDIMNTLFNILTGQLTFITETFKLF